MLGDMTGQEDTQPEEETFFDKYFPYGTTAPPAGTYKMDIDDRPTKQLRNGEDQRKGGHGRERGKGRAPRQDREGERSRRQPDSGHRRSPTGSERRSDDREIAELQSSLHSLQRLVLRHEDSLGLIQAEYSFVAFLRISSASSVVPNLYEAQRAWRDLRESDPAKLSKPMRCSLLTCLFKELHTRMINLESEPENRARLQKLGWLGSDASSWPYLAWASETKQLAADAARGHMKLTEALSLVKEVQDLVSVPGLVVRFHPTRPLTPNMAGETLTCCLQVSIREEKAKLLYEHLSNLSGLACTQLVGMGLRKDRASRSALAQAISRSM